jgi:H+/Na+-translocating ferredoxin:NAD+ oxidoreductase subunit G
MKSEVAKMGITLLVVGVVAAVGLGLTYTVTRSKIEAYDRQVEAKASLAALPGLTSSNQLEEDQVLEDKAQEVDGVEKVFKSDKGYIFKINTKGYGGPLVLAVGVDLSGKVAGVAVVASKETVGVGSKVLEDDNLKRWVGKTAKDKLVVGEDIQAVTGATITSKAVNGQVKKALQAYRLITR